MTATGSSRGTKHSVGSGSRPTAGTASTDPANIARILDELRLNWRIPGGMS